MKKYLKIIVSLIIVLTIVSFMTISKAENAKEESIVDFIINNTSIDLENFQESDVITIVQELVDNYSTDELADILEQYSDELEESGLDKESLNMATGFLRTTNSDALKSIMKDIDLDGIKERVDAGESLDDVIEDSIDNMGAEQIAGIAAKTLLSSGFVKTIITYCTIIVLLITIYMIIIRWRIYTKAGKHGWAALIPIYRDVVWLKIAGLSPWLLLLCLIPIFGWIAIGIIHIVSCFKLPEAFGRSCAWGIGLWLVPIVFESIFAFSKEFEIKREEENEVVESSNE